jgi:hypothetical protein
MNGIKSIKALLIVVVALVSLNLYGQSAVKGDSLRFELLLSKAMVDSVNFNVPFTNSVQITSDHHLLLASENQFYILGWGGIQPVGKQFSKPLSAFEYTSDSTLMVVQDNRLCYIDSVGNMTKLYELPYENMKIAAGKNVMYLYDQNMYLTKHPLYVLAKGGRYIELFVSPTVITAVAENGDNLLFASENVLFSVNIITKSLVTLAVLPNKDQQINSITVDLLSKNIFLSSDNAIFAVKGNQLACVTENFSGTLRYSNNSLFVFNADKKFLVRIVGIDRMFER